MTYVSDINFDEDTNYSKYLDYGFVGLIDMMGDDSSIVQAARVSYGKGTKSTSGDRALIRYLMKHKHTSPFEMIELKFHLKMPIFVMRQVVRHRTTSINEWSGRYSEMTDEFYIPKLDSLKPQSQSNKQGRNGEMSQQEKNDILDIIEDHCTNTYMIYNHLLTTNEGLNKKGLTRELARIVLPLNNYTELYWKINLHNFFHFTKLRKDHHAQWEIQELASKMYEFVKSRVPVACEAFEDYIEKGSSLSRMETELLKTIISESNVKCNYTDEELEKMFNLGKREINEFKQNWSSLF